MVTSTPCSDAYPLAQMVPFDEGWAVKVHFNCARRSDEGVIRIHSPDGSLRPPANVSWEARIPDNGPSNASFLFPAEVVSTSRGVAIARWWHAGWTDGGWVSYDIAELGKTDDEWQDVYTYDGRFIESVPWQNGSTSQMGPWIHVFPGGPTRHAGTDNWHHADKPFTYNETQSGQLRLRLEGDATGRLVLLATARNIIERPRIDIEVMTPWSLDYEGVHDAWNGDGELIEVHEFLSLGAARMELRVQASWQNDNQPHQDRCMTFHVEPADAFVFYVGGSNQWVPCP